MRHHCACCWHGAACSGFNKACAAAGRAAMLGFVAAVVSELATRQSVWSQIAGKYVDGDLVERPIGSSTLFFGAIVVLLTYASIAPQFQAGARGHPRRRRCRIFAWLVLRVRLRYVVQMWGNYPWTGVLGTSMNCLVVLERARSW